jgi:DNA-entry nuclease
VDIDYATGDSALAAPAGTEDGAAVTYILNTGTMKFHYPDCASVAQMKEENKAAFTGTREELLAMGYSPCGQCKP